MDLSWLTSSTSLLVVPALIVGILALILIGKLWKTFIFYWLTNGVAIVNGIKNYLTTGDVSHIAYAFNPFYYYDLSLQNADAPTILSFVLLFIVLFYILKTLFKSWDVTLFITFLTGYVAGGTLPNLRAIFNFTNSYVILGYAVSDVYLFPLIIGLMIFTPRILYYAWYPSSRYLGV